MYLQDTFLLTITNFELVPVTMSSKDHVTYKIKYNIDITDSLYPFYLDIFERAWNIFCSYKVQVNGLPLLDFRKPFVTATIN